MLTDLCESVCEYLAMIFEKIVSYRDRIGTDVRRCVFAYVLQDTVFDKMQLHKPVARIIDGMDFEIELKKNFNFKRSRMQQNAITHNRRKKKNVQTNKTKRFSLVVHTHRTSKWFRSRVQFHVDIVTAGR